MFATFDSRAITHKQGIVFGLIWGLFMWLFLWRVEPGNWLIQLVSTQKILNDLRHLEKVVASKIAEIEADLEKL